jgi:predicted Zn-dependent peptidase
VYSAEKNGGKVLIKKVLDNKITIIYKGTKGAGIIAGNIFFKGGSLEDPEGKKGLTNLTFKMLLKGTRNYDFVSLNKLFEDSGGYISTSVTEEYANIEFALRTKDFEEGLKRIQDLILNPLFPEEKLNQEKINVISQIKAKKEEGFSYAYDQLKKIIYKGTPYQYPVLGEIEDVETITVKDLKKRWNEITEGSRIVISIVGDMPFEKSEKLLKETFSKIKNEKDFKYPEYDLKIKGETCKTLKREGAQSTIIVAYNAPEAKDKDYFAMKVLNGIIGSGFSSRLFQELREKRGLAYAVASFFPTRINMGRFFGYIGTAPEKTEEALKGMREVIGNYKSGITDEELKTAKEKIIGHFLLDHQTRVKQAWYLGWFETIGLGYEMDENYTKNIETVKKDDVISAWKKYIPEGNACVVVKP